MRMTFCLLSYFTLGNEVCNVYIFFDLITEKSQMIKIYEQENYPVVS